METKFVNYSLKDQNFPQHVENDLKVHTYNFLYYTGCRLLRVKDAMARLWWLVVLTELVTSMNNVLENAISILK